MSLKIFNVVTPPIEENAYLAMDEVTGDGFVVDPGGAAEEIVAVAKREGIKVKAILLTHGHWDHIGALDAVRKAFGAPVYVHESDAAMLSDPVKNVSAFMSWSGEVKASSADKLLREGDKIPCGEFFFEVIHTPGHTPGGVCYYSAGAGVLFSGDSLFREEIGRCDLPGGSMRSLVTTLREKIAALPEETRVYPGHGPASDIAHERKYNPYIAVR